MEDYLNLVEENKKLKKDFNDAQMKIIELNLIIKRLEKKIEFPIRKTSITNDSNIIQYDSIHDK